jgi:hypothetical protein
VEWKREVEWREKERWSGVEHKATIRHLIRLSAVHHIVTYVQLQMEAGATVSLGLAVVIS